MFTLYINGLYVFIAVSGVFRCSHPDFNSNRALKTNIEEKKSPECRV